MNVRRHGLPLFWQILIPNSLVLAGAGALLTFGPATGSSPPLLFEIVVVTTGIGCARRRSTILD